MIPGETRTVELSLAHQNQDRARLQFFACPDDAGFRPLEREVAASMAKSAGLVDLRKLPGDLFGEMRIRMQVTVHARQKAGVMAWLDGELLRSATISVPRTGAARTGHRNSAGGWSVIRKAALALGLASLGELVFSLAWWLAGPR